MADVRITEFTDPGCPWAFSAEPFKRRLRWLYGDRLEWLPRMVVLSESPEEYEAKGVTPSDLAKGMKNIARDHGMPIATHERSRMHATLPSCRAVVAAREHGADAEGLLRCLRVRAMGGELLDEETTISGAAADAGVDEEILTRDVEAAVREDMALAREPSAAARVLDARLANWSGGRRYTCPSYEITRLSDGVTIAVPGFQPFAAYDVVLANLVPGVDRREAPTDVCDVLRWAGTPLATQEVATVCELSRAEAREALGRVAVERHVGTDGYWTLAA